MGGKSSKPTESGPPKWAVPYLKEGMGDARDAYRGGQFAMSPEAMAANNLGIGEYQKIAQGDYLDPANNPAFQTALARARTPLDSYFAKAGRYGSGAHAGQVAEAFGNISANQYNVERNNQMQALPKLLQQTEYGDDARYREIAKYFNLVNPGVGASGVSQTNYSNPLAGAIGGGIGGYGLMQGMAALSGGAVPGFAALAPFGALGAAAPFVLGGAALGGLLS